MLTRNFLTFALIAMVSVAALAKAPDPADCKHCDNTGKAPCPTCKDTVELWCSECHANLQCKTCLGIGWILCNHCKGANAQAEREFLLEQRNQHLLVGQQVGTNLRVIETPRFRLLTDVEHQQAHRYAALLENFCHRFNELFGYEPEEKLWEYRCDVYLFQPRTAFVRFAVRVDNRPEVATSGGYSSPSPAQPLIVLFQESRNSDETLRTMIHELAHVYLDLYYKTAPIPTWVHEGVAQKFEFMHKPETSRRTESIRILRHAMNSRMLMTLPELSEMRITHTDLLPHAASWSAIDFLMQRDRQAFIEWIKLMKDGMDQHTALRTAYGQSPGSLARHWIAYVKRLK